MTATGRGFTLLEVLVALAILAISATAIIGQTSQGLSDQAQLEAKTIATLIAESRLDLANASDAFPALGRGSDVVTFNGREWRVSTTVSGTSEPWLRRVEVTVSEQAQGDRELVTLVGYRGKY